MRKQFAYVETLSNVGGKNIAIPGLGEISEAKMMFAMMIIIFGFLANTSVQVHIAILIMGLAILAIPETSVGIDKTLAGAINYYLHNKEQGRVKKSVQPKKTIHIPIKTIKGYWQTIVGTTLTVAGIELANINIAEYFVEVLVLVVIGLVLVLTDYLIRVIEKS